MESRGFPEAAGPVPPLGREAGVAVRWNAAAALAALLSQFVQLVVLARWLAPAEFGLAAVAIAVTGFASGFADLGMTNALVQRRDLPEKAWASAWWAAGAAGSALCLAGIALSGGIAGLLRLDGLAPLLSASALSLPFFGAASIFQARLQRHLRFRRLAAGEILAAAASLAVAAGWVLWRPEPMALIAGQVALVLVRFVLLGALSGLRPLPRLRPAELRPLSAFGGFQMGERALNHAAGNLDRLLVAGLLGPAAAGYYAMATQIALRPMTLIGPFLARTLLPLLARLQGEPARMAGAYLRALSLLSFAAAATFSLLFGLADPLLRMVLGPGWEPSIPALRVLAALGFLLAVGHPLGHLALALGRAGIHFWINAAVLVARVIAVLIGARFGVTGVAAGMLAVTALTLPLDLLLPRAWLGIAPGRVLRAAGWAVPAAVLAAAFGFSAAGRLPVPAMAEAAILGIAGAALFVLCVRLLARRRLRGSLRELGDVLRGR